jgi:predicted PurR-regulated permease PerM
VVVLVLALVVTVGLLLFASELIQQFNQLIESLPQSLERVREYISTPAWGGGLLGRLPSVNELLTGETVMSNVTTIFSTTFGMLINLLIILAIGIYAAAEPYLYVNGFVRLFPVGERGRIREVLEEVHHTLQRWLVGRLVSMVVIGTLTTVGLWLLGVPLAPILGLLAAFLEFVPYIGPILSLVPAALLGLLDSPTTALYVILLYLGIQLFESYILTPLVEQQAVSIPPALTITVQLLAGVVIGGIGLLFATPLTAAVMVLVENLYIEDTLDE